MFRVSKLESAVWNNKNTLQLMCTLSMPIDYIDSTLQFPLFSCKQML